MTIKEALVMFHRTVARVVLGKKNVDLDADCKAKSSERRGVLEKKVKQLETRTSEICDDAGMVVHNGQGGSR